MGVYVNLTAEAAKGMLEKPGSYIDGADTEYAYASTDGGVVRVLVSAPGQNTWRVATEFGPGAWLEVGGKRYTEDSSKLPGFVGGVGSKPTPSRRLVQQP